MLEELVDLEEFALDEQDAIRDFVLYASLLLKKPSFFLLPSTATTEIRNEHSARTLEIFSLSKATGLLKQRLHHYFDHLQLPDVCGCCFRGFGFCSEGRVRFSCRYCIDDMQYDKRMALQRLLELHRLCPWGSINTLIFSQLIHKFYSPEGEPAWLLRIPKTLT